MAGFRERDMRVERELAKFMDKYLYSDPKFTRHERTDDRDSQLRGSDIILSVPSLNLDNIVVDEKGMTQYLTRPLPTFALELSFLTFGKEVIGWFVDDDKATEYYMCIWPKANKGWNVTMNDFTEVEYMLVSKKALRDFFARKGYTKEALIRKSDQIRREGVDGPIDKVADNDYWFFYTTKLVEKPINIVVRKSIYKQLAVMSGVIKV